MKETQFKITEWGSFPMEWATITIEEIGVFAKGRGISRKECGTGTIPCVRYGEIYTTHNDYIKSFSSYISKEVALSSTPISNGDLLFTASGETKEDIGKCVAYTKKEEAYAGGDIIIISTYKDFCTLLLGYLLNSNYVTLQKSQRAQGDAVVHITSKAISTIQIYLPPSLSEQHRIATALSDIDTLITSLGKLIDKKRHIKLATMQQLLTGRKRLKGFSEPWEKYKLSDIFEFGNGYTPSKSIKSFWEGGTLPWFRMEDIRKNGRILSDSILHITPQALKNGGLFPAGSFILSTTATIGEHALLIADSLANQRFTFLWNVNRSIPYDRMFFFYYLYVVGDWCRSNINDGGLLAVNTQELKALICLIPASRAEQRAIAQVLSDMDSDISSLEHRQAKLKAVKQGMMQQLLTGRIRLIDNQ